MRMQANILIGIASALLGLSAVIFHTTEQNYPQMASLAGQPAAVGGGKYVFALFHEGSNEAKPTMWQSLQTCLAKRPCQAIAVNIRINDPALKTVVDRYGLSPSHLPLLLAIAPNGAVTGAFASELTEQDVAASFVSSRQADCMKEEQMRQFVSRLVAPTTASWPTISTWYLLTSRPAASNPIIVSRCCSCFERSAARKARSQLTEHLHQLTDFCLLGDRSCLDENLLEPRVNITATK